MWMKPEIIATFCICSLSYIMCQTSDFNYCQPGETGHQECEGRKAVCRTTGQSYVCECTTGMQFGSEENGECEDIDMCGSDSPGYRFCESDLALCRNAPNTPEGFECYCAEGKVKTEGLCKDALQIMTLSDPTAVYTSTSSPVLSSSGTENTSFETLDDSSKSDITDIFNTSPEPTHSSSLNTSPEPTDSSSSFDLPASYDYDSSTSLISDAPDVDECARYKCSQNATCIKLSHGVTCTCKVGFVPNKKLSSTKSYCLGNCTLEGCEETCKHIKCILKKEEEKSTNTSACIYFENKYSGWPTESVIICSLLTLVVLIFIVSTVLLLHRYKKLRKMRQFEDKQIVYKKMDKSSLCSESKDNLVLKGIGYI